MGKYEVTFAEYDHFAEKTRREKPNDRGWGRGP
jgi:formylglycine-generating enzyme required for sulfatase activity